MVGMVIVGVMAAFFLGVAVGAMLDFNQKGDNDQ